MAEDKNQQGPSKEELERQKDFLATSKEIERNERSYLQTLKNIEEAKMRTKQLESQIERLRQQGTQDAEDQAQALEKNLEQQKKQIQTYKEGLKQISWTRKLVTEPLGRSIDQLGNKLKDGFLSELKKTPDFVLDATKEIKNAELRMGKLNENSNAFTQKLTEAGMEATSLGSSIGEMAQMQADFTEKIGRSVSVTKEGNEAMAALAQGTTLGKEGAAELAANMDLFGKSVVQTEDRMDELLKSSQELGLSTEKVTKNFQEATQLANKFHFEEGVEDMQKLAEQAAKYGSSVESVAGMAEQAFNVEGAVEMAAKLQTMGGEFAKLGNFNKLMYQARNDMQGLHKDVMEASKGLATFNEETGQFEVTGLQLQRAREIAEMTSMSVEELTKAGRRGLRFDRAKRQMPVDVSLEGNDKVKEFITNKAVFEDGRGKIMIRGEQKWIDQLEDSDIKKIKTVQEEKKTAEKMAKRAKTFDEAFDNFINMVKTTLAPAFMAFSDAVTGGIQSFHESLKNEGVELSKQLKTWGQKAGELVNGLILFIKNNPLSALTAISTTAFIGKMAQWMARGAMLGKGFLSQTKGKMGMGGGTGGYGPGGRGGKYGKYQNYSRKEVTDRYNRMKGKNVGRGPLSRVKDVGRRVGKSGFGRGVSAVGRGLGKFGRAVGPGGGMVAGLAGTAADVLSDKYAKDGGFWDRAGDIGGGALQMGGTGAMIGSMIAPGIGTAIGGGIGALAGGLSGYYQDSGGAKKQRGHQPIGKIDKVNDFIARPGEGVVPFNEKDTIMGMKDDGPIEKSFTNRGDDDGKKEMSVNFERPLEVTGNITISSEKGDTLENIDFDKHPQLKKNITRMVQEEVTKNVDGGKLQPNP